MDRTCLTTSKHRSILHYCHSTRWSTWNRLNIEHTDSIICNTINKTSHDRTSHVTLSIDESFNTEFIVRWILPDSIIGIIEKHMSNDIEHEQISMCDLWYTCVYSISVQQQLLLSIETRVRLDKSIHVMLLFPHVMKIAIWLA
jgi:hypothetical protein